MVSIKFYVLIVTCFTSTTAIVQSNMWS